MGAFLRFFLKRIPRPLLIRLSYPFRLCVDFLYRGKRYHDPINGRGYRSFFTYGYRNPRKNVLSPGTLSLERHRLIWLYLKNETKFFTEKSNVLHIAPEQCFLSRFKELKNLKYTTTDLLSPIVDVRANIKNLPFEDCSFDIVLCNHVLEHIDDDLKALKEIHRVLKKGGWGIIQVPLDKDRQKTFEDNSITSKKERTKIFGQYDHLRIYGLDYFDLLKSVGFVVKPIAYADRFSNSEIDKFRLQKQEILPIVRKV